MRFKTLLALLCLAVGCAPSVLGQAPPPMRNGAALDTEIKDRPTPEPRRIAVAPRPVSPAEREAVRLVAAYLAGGAEPIWTALAPDAALRALGREAAIDEIKVRFGPVAGARWRLVTPGPRHGASTVIFSVEFPSGLGDTVLLEFSGGRTPQLRRIACLVDPQLKSAPILPATTSAAAAAPAFALVLALAVALFGLARARRSSAPQVARKWVAPSMARKWVTLLGLAGLLACGRSPGARSAPATGETVARLGALLPLREALAGASGADREGLFARLPAEPVANAAGRLWHVDELLLRGQLNDASAMLAGVEGAASYPLAALLRGRLAFLRADAAGTDKAFEEALDQGPDHDALRLEAARAVTLLGDDREFEIALQQAGEMGSRDAGVFYGLAQVALEAESNDEAESLFRTAWSLQPLGRDTLLGNPGLAALCARPGLFSLLALSRAEEPTAQPDDLGRDSIAWPAGTAQRLTGRALSAAIQGAVLDVPAGSPLATAAAELESPAGWRAREEDEALARLPALEQEAGAGAWSRAALRRDVELATYALAHRARWPDLLRLTESAERALDQVGSEIVQMRALALRESARGPEAKDLLVRLAKSDIANRHRDPSPFFQLAELMASQDEIDLAVRLYKRALSLSPVRAGSARLRQLEMEQRLVASAHTRQTAHFLLRYPDVTGEKFAGQLIGVLEQEWQRLQAWIPLARAERVKVDLFPVEEFLRDYSGGVPVLGIFDGRVRVPLADLHSLRPVLVSILSHEMAHALITQRTHDRASKWLQEGLAQHIQMSNQTVNPFPELVKTGRQLSLPVVEAALGGFSEEQFVDIAYGQALWTVHFIEAKWGAGGLRRLLDSYAAGGTGDKPLRDAFGLGYTEFDQALWRWAVDSAPLSWPTTLRRYDEETARAELLEPDPDRRAAAAPTADAAERQRRAMADWHARYAARAQAVKQALGPVIGVYRGGQNRDVAPVCRSLSNLLVGLLQDPSVFAAPDPAVALPLRRAYLDFQKLANACEMGRGNEVLAALGAAESELGAAAKAMQPWNLRP